MVQVVFEAIALETRVIFRSIPVDFLRHVAHRKPRLALVAVVVEHRADNDDLQAVRERLEELF